MADEKLAWAFSFASIDDGQLALSEFMGNVLLITNTASFCGYTYQYGGLRKLHRAEAAQGLTVIGVPSRDFNQESADSSTVKAFCETRYGVDFPLAGISHVRGPLAAPFYAWVHDTCGWQPDWNFNKVLIGRDGRVAGTFGSSDEPDRGRLHQAVVAELAKTA
jgi:glutathione peroxidase